MCCLHLQTHYRLLKLLKHFVNRIKLKSKKYYLIKTPSKLYCTMYGRRIFFVGVAKLFILKQYFQILHT